RLSLRFFFSSRRRHTRFSRDWSSDVCSSDLSSSTIPTCVANAAAARASTSEDAVGIPCHYALFELQPAFDLDLEQLSARYRELARKVHPDRFADAGESEQRQAIEQSANLNEAY